MSDIQEEQKRLYKRAEEIDKEQEINNKFSRIVREKMKDKSAVEMIVLQDEEINRLNNIINETRRILGEYVHYSTPTEEQNAKNEAIVDEAYMQLHNNLKELKGDNK